MDLRVPALSVLSHRQTLFQVLFFCNIVPSPTSLDQALIPYSYEASLPVTILMAPPIHIRDKHVPNVTWSLKVWAWFESKHWCFLVLSIRVM